jgi:hypothetical protein
MEDVEYDGITEVEVKPTREDLMAVALGAAEGLISMYNSGLPAESMKIQMRGIVSDIMYATDGMYGYNEEE